jgi:hypothetical protein
VPAELSARLSFSPISPCADGKEFRPCPFFLFLLDFRLVEVEDVVGGSFDGPAGALYIVRPHVSNMDICKTYPGLDMTAAEALPLRFFVVVVAAGGAGGSGSETFCRLLPRRAEEGLAGAGSGIGLGSRAGALRFLVVVVCRAGAGGAGNGTATEGELSEEAAACRADERVVLEDMSMWL